MIKIFLSLLCSGLVSVSYQNNRFQKILSVVGGIFFISILYFFYMGQHKEILDTYSYAWLSSRYYPVNIDFSFGNDIYQYCLILLSVATLNVLYSLGDSFERQKLYIFALSCFSLAFFIMLLCGQNTIQILVSVCFLDVIGFCLINNIFARRNYIFYNLFADMFLFMACAILWGSCHTNLISKLAQCRYEEKDFALYFMAFSAIIKMGLFPFQGHLMSSVFLTQSRQNFLGFLSTPVAGFLILYKMLPLLSSLTNVNDIFYYLSLATIVWGGIGAVCQKNLEHKKIYLNLIFYGLICGLLFQDKDFSLENIGALFVMHFCVNNVMKATQHFFGFCAVLSVALVAAIILLIEAIGCSSLTFLYLTATLLAVGSLLYTISSSEREDNHWGALLLSALCVAGGIYKIPSVPAVFYYWLVGYVILIIWRPYRFLSAIYNYQQIQQANVFSNMLYMLFASPILFLGRILWLTVDFLIIERTFLSSLSRIKNILEAIFIWLHQSFILNILIFWILGLGIIVYACYGGL